MEYAIAYLGMNGTGHSILEPFIHDDIDCAEDAEKQKIEMEMVGFRHVTVFKYEENNLPEFITWNFVNSHRV